MSNAVVFDLDGTLANTMGIYGKYASTLISATYHIPLQDAVMRYFGTAGRPFSEQLEVIFPGNSLNEFAAHDFAEYKSSVQNKLNLYDDAFNACLKLKEAGFTLGVCSSTEIGHVTKLVNNSDLATLISFITGHDGAELTKVRQLATFKKNLRCPLTFVGDTFYDARIADEAGTQFLAVAHTFPCIDFTSRGIPATDSLFHAAERIINDRDN